MSSNKRPRLDDADSSPSSADDVLQIHPNGDLFLKAGDGDKAVVMQVKKDVLTHFSTYFASMFGPSNWQEGTKKYTKQDPLELKDHDPRAVELIMRVAHHSLPSVEEIPMEDLPSVIAVGHYFGCLKTLKVALQGAVHSWYFENSRHFSHMSREILCETASALCIAFLIDDKTLFGKLSNNLLMEVSANMIMDDGIWNGGLMAIMPSNFKDKLKIAHEAALRRAYLSLFTPLRKLSQCVSRNGEVFFDCPALSERTMMYAVLLSHQHQDLPSLEIGDHQPVQDLSPYFLMDTTKEYFTPLPAHQRCGNDYECLCGKSSGDLFDEISRQKPDFVGLVCLVCFKEGDNTKILSECKHRA